jgi:preprotein translocase subunit SecG
MYTILITLHIIACTVLIAVILLQAGKGAGLSNVFGGGGGGLESIFGTKTSTFLTKATTVCAILFIVTCLGLTILSSHRRVSLMEDITEKQQQEQVDDQQVDEQSSVPAQAE